MSAPMVLSASARKSGQADKQRALGKIPAVLYGPDISPTSICVPYREFERLRRDAGSSSLVALSLEEGGEFAVLIQDVQYDPVTDGIIHADFRQVNIDKEMDATIELRFSGESLAVKELGGTLVKALDSVRITCMPKDLVSYIPVDIGHLADFDDVIRVSDLVLPSGMRVHDNPATTVARVLPPLTEEQLKAMEEQGPKDIEDIEVAEKLKKEGEGEGEEADEGQDKGDKKAEKFDKKE